MRAFVASPHVETIHGQQVMIGNRNDGWSVMIPVAGTSQESLLRQMTSYLDDQCRCDSSQPWMDCPIHREVALD
jgi:hypothetical protein